jgi:hypothetical protein
VTYGCGERVFIYHILEFLTFKPFGFQVEILFSPRREEILTCYGKLGLLISCPTSKSNISVLPQVEDKWLIAQLILLLV